MFNIACRWQLFFDWFSSFFWKLIISVLISPQGEFHSTVFIPFVLCQIMCRRIGRARRRIHVAWVLLRTLATAPTDASAVKKRSGGEEVAQCPHTCEWASQWTTNGYPHHRFLEPAPHYPCSRPYGKPVWDWVHFCAVVQFWGALWVYFEC